MKTVTDFPLLIEHLASRQPRRRMAVCWPADEHTRQAVCLALEAGLVHAIFVGCTKEVLADPALAPFSNFFSLVDATDCDDAAAKAVALVHKGDADILMKGMLNTDNLLRAILNKDTGILPKGSVLTHVTAVSIPAYHKLLLFSDAAVIPYPNPSQRRVQISSMARICRNLGAEVPRIALIHCSEKVDERHFPFTADYLACIDECRQGAFGSAIVHGPLDVKTSLSLHALQEKGLKSPIEGEADALVFPDIEAANAFYKTLTLFCHSSNAGILVGAQAPVVLSSRGDSAQSKFYSIALACAI